MMRLWSKVPFHYFSITSVIKFHFTLIQILLKWLLQNFAHDTTAVLLCHVQNVDMIWSPRIESQLNVLYVLLQEHAVCVSSMCPVHVSLCRLCVGL